VKRKMASLVRGGLGGVKGKHSLNGSRGGDVCVGNR